MKTKTLNDNTQASHPGGIQLSHEKMRWFHPELYEHTGIYKLLKKDSPDQKLWRTRNEEHLLNGDGRAALVISVNPLLVAAYSDELDCIAMLKFPRQLVEENALQVGSRLLTINVYARGQRPVADLENGPASQYRYANFRPYIAEFLSDSTELIEARKAEIPETEWARTAKLAQSYMVRYGEYARDGCPMTCATPAWENVE